ncbi:MAG: hypothetical protein LBL00_08480 [Endomicrobium sp.]|jgi:hypothetical protein|nr:hypothetical protein [Endomicrobium sp.]
MKFIILPLIFLFISINVFAQNAQTPAQDAQKQRQEELLKKQEEKKQKKELKEKQKAEEAQKKTEEKQKIEQEKLFKRQEKEKKAAEAKQKEESEKKQKAEDKENKKQKNNPKTEQEKLLLRHQKEQKKQEEKKKAADEKQKKESEEKQKIEQIQKQEQETEKIRLEEKQKKKTERQQAKEKRKKEKAEKKKLKLQKKQEAQAANEEAAASLVLDYDLRFTAASYSNLDYTYKEAKSESVYRQYLGVNIIGKFDDRIEMSAKLASYGISGKQNEAFDMPYLREKFSFFLESAYLNFKSETDAFIPYVLTFGKQYFTAGDGFIIDSNQNGLLGARVKADILDSFSVDVFAGKVDNIDFSVYGGSIKFKIAPAIEIGIYQERNDTGFAYEKGVVSDSGVYTINSDIKTFYDIRLTGGNQKYKYRLEAAQQTGQLVRSSMTDTVDYDVFAFVAEGSWKGQILKMEANAKMVFSYAQAEDENSFSPTFARRYDGLQRIGYGTLFAASGGDSFLILPYGYRGINTIGVNFDVFPWKFLQTGLGFYMYSASDAPPDAGDAGFAKLYGAKADLGNEIDFSVKYEYLNYFDIRFGFAVYTPPTNGGKVFSNTQASYLYQIEVNAKF